MEALGDLSPMVIALVGSGSVLLVAALSALGLMARRQRRRDLREVVAVVEEMRSGRPRRRVEVDPRSSLVLVADAVNRLGQDLAARRTDAEIADEGLKAILEAARDYAIVATDGGWDVRSASPGATAMFGIEPEAMIGRSAAALFDEASWKDLIPKFARRNLRERGVDVRCSMVRHDGSRFQARVVVRPYGGEGSQAAGFLIVIHDISAEVRVENELRESEARYRGLVEGLPDAVAVLRDGCVAYANPSFCTLLGLGSHEVAGVRLRDRVETPDVLVLQDALASLEKGGDGEPVDLRIRLTGVRGGGGAAVRVMATAVKHEGVAAVLATLRDETSERRVDEELRRNESRLDAVVEAAAEGLVVLADSPAGAVVTMTNAAFARLTGLDRGRVLGAGAAALAIMLRARGEGGARLASLVAGEGTPVTKGPFEMEGADAKGVVEADVAPMRGRGGRMEGRILVLRDLSDAATAQQGLLSSVDELRRAKEELEAAYRELHGEREDVARRQEDLVRLNTELRSLDSMKSDLLANVSHELQTPLVSIRGYTEMILKERLGPVNAEQRKGLTLSLRNIDRLIALIDNLLSFSRADRGAGEMNLSVFPVATVVDEAIALLEDRIQARRITVTKNLEDPEIEIRGDRDKILQVFVNLLSNALKFNHEAGSIEIVARRGKPGFALVQVHDTGVGIPEIDLEKVFDRFYRVESPGERPQEGSGIGLAIVRGILRLHGCVVRATSRVGEGTTFTFTLPLAEPASAAGVREPQGVRKAAPPPDEVRPAATVPSTPEPVAGAPSDPPPVVTAPKPGVRVIRRA